MLKIGEKGFVEPDTTFSQTIHFRTYVFERFVATYKKKFAVGSNFAFETGFKLLNFDSRVSKNFSRKILIFKCCNEKLSNTNIFK